MEISCLGFLSLRVFFSVLFLSEFFPSSTEAEKLRRQGLRRQALPRRLLGGTSPRGGRVAEGVGEHEKQRGLVEKFEEAFFFFSLSLFLSSASFSLSTAAAATTSTTRRRTEQPGALKKTTATHKRMRLYR